MERIRTMVDPVRYQQIGEQRDIELCEEIFKNARNELYLNMRFLDVSLSSVRYEVRPGIGSIGTNGFSFFYDPDYLFYLYKKGRVQVNRAYLHMVFHCLFCHMDTRGNRERYLWDLSCDIAMEAILDGLYQKCTYQKRSPYRRNIYLWLEKELDVLTAQGVYTILQKSNISKEEREALALEFYVDSHEYWDDKKVNSSLRQNSWSNKREKMQTNMETFSNDEDESHKSLRKQVEIENREKYDYKQFLRKFAVLKEELYVDEDSFDYAFYTYGLSLYGNMPLVEPLEYKEQHKIEDFVIVIDTSMSCSGELVKRFLEETYTILWESESYFRKVNIRIIQCDDQVQADKLVTNKEEMKEYMEQFTIIGQGGTDFRPAFKYVNNLMAKGAFTKLKGLLYFTDGQGIFPLKKPIYDTAFIFIREQYADVSVPPWAIKLILEQGDLEEMSKGGKEE